MASSSTTFKQDLPPEGGYRPINWTRIPAKTYFSSKTWIAGMLVMTVAGFYGYSLCLKIFRRETLEVNDATLAVEPLLLAERDREVMKQLRRNREDEAKLMKNVPGWQVGTLYGEPIYKTLHRDAWTDPLITEYYAHTNKKFKDNRIFLQLYQ